MPQRHVAVLALVIAGACSAQTMRANAQEVVARMGTADIRIEEVEAFLKTLGEREQAAVRGDAALLSQAVRLYLTNRLVLKEAAERKFDGDPEVKLRIERAREAVIIEGYIQAATKAPAGFPTEADVQAFYNANVQSFFAPRQFKLSQIFIAGSNSDSVARDAATKKLAAVQAKLKAPNPDFAAIAKIDSDSRESAEKGGELGWLLETQLRADLIEKLVVLPKGGVSEPVQLDDGYHILRLTDTRAAGPLPIAEVRDRIVAALGEQRQTQARRAFIAQIIDKNPIALNEFALTKLVQPKSGETATAVTASTPQPTSPEPAVRAPAQPALPARR